MKQSKPLIGITTDYKDKYYGIEKTYSAAVARYGGLPVLIPSVARSSRVLKELVNRIDGLLIPGSRDMDTKHYNQEPHPKLNLMNRERTAAEYIILEQALTAKVPVFGICGGMQFINVFFGGDLYQDIKSLLPDAGDHEKGAIHKISIKPGTILKKIINKSSIKVTSYHHQAIKKIGSGLKISASADDNITEALESEDGLVLAVQWHPELQKDYISKSLFQYFINKSVE